MVFTIYIYVYYDGLNQIYEEKKENLYTILRAKPILSLFKIKL